MYAVGSRPREVGPLKRNRYFVFLKDDLNFQIKGHFEDDRTVKVVLLYIVILMRDHGDRKGCGLTNVEAVMTSQFVRYFPDY